MRKQATKANRAQVDLHIRRQRHLGEGMIGGWDKPKPLELAATALAIIALIIWRLS